MRASRPSSSRRPRCRARQRGLPIQFVLRTIGDPAQAYEVAERVRKSALASGRFIVVQNSISYRDAACADRRRSRPGRGTRRAGHRDRHDARRARRRCADLEIRPRQPQLRRGQPGFAGEPPQSRTARPVLCPRRRTASWCRSRRWFASRRARLPRSIEQFNQLNSATLSALPLPTVTTSEGLQTLRSHRSRSDAGRLL